MMDSFSYFALSPANTFQINIGMFVIKTLGKICWC